jgi:hypothetical protein
VGFYQFGQSGTLTVTRNGQQLFAQLTGQPAIPIYPQSDSEFFLKVVNAQISFITDPQGVVASLVLHQNGQNITRPRIDAATAKQIADNIAAKVQSQTPTPGSKAALRRLIAGILAGQANYEEMSPELAQATRQQLPQLQAIAALGAVESVEFGGCRQRRLEHGSSQWRIALGSNGIITGALVTAGPLEIRRQ